MNKKNKIIVSITGIVLVLLILIGLTYGYYLTRISGNTSDKSISIDMANLELTYSDGNGLIEAKSIIPGETIATKTFTVKNTGNAKINNYVVYLDSVINNFEDKNDLKLTLTCTSDIGNCNGTNITYPSTNIMLVTNDIEEKETQSYELKVEFIETNDDQSDNMNKEMSGNILIKDIKGLNSTLETVTGTNELVVENAKLLSNYRIYGNSVQSGTPAPDNYSGVENFGDNNLLDMTYEMKHSGSESVYQDRARNVNLIKIKNGVTYTITPIKLNGFQYAVNTSSSVYPFKQYNYAGNNQGFNSSRYTFTATKDGYMSILLKKSGGSYFTLDDINGVKINVSSNEENQYKIPIKVTGKNLLDMKNAKGGISNGVTASVNSDGSVNCTGTAESVTINIWLLGGYYSTTEIMNLSPGKYCSKDITLMMYDGTNRKQFQNCFEVSESEYPNGFSITAVRLKQSAVGADWNKTIYPMIEEGTVSTEWEPYQEELYNIYLNEPLRKIGEYSDYIDFKTGKVVRNIGKDNLSNIVLQSKTATVTSNNYMQTGLYTANNLKFRSNNLLSDSSTLDNLPFIMCENLPTISWNTMKNNNTIYGLCITEDSKKTSNEIRVSLPESVATSVSTAQQWLSDNDSSFYYVYLPKFVTEESVTLPTINLNSTRNYISIDTSVSPSNTELEVIK